MTATHRLPDGRTIAWGEYGDPSGYPTFLFHGTPGSHVSSSLADEAAKALSVRLLAPDRPGMGGSDPLPGRTVGGYSDDVAALADHLGLDTFAVAGMSGGGPYAMACGARLGSRVSTVVLVSGTAPSRPEDRKGMSAQGRMGHFMATRLPAAIAVPLLGAQLRRVASLPREKMQGMLKGLPEADAKVLRQPGMLEVFQQDFAEAIRQGPKWAVLDMRLVSSPYDFAIEDVKVPVHLFHGTDDANVPVSIARSVAARLPDCTAEFIEGEGHMWCLANFDRVLGAVTTVEGS